jgi:predicted metal-dependent hydrolase
MRNPLQLALDFLTGGDLPPSPARTPTPPVPTPLHKPVQRSQPPMTSPLLPAGAGQTWGHASANRQALLQGVDVPYRFERSRRRSIGFTVGPEGLVVRAPSWVPLREIDAAVLAKADWILSKLRLMRERQQDALVPTTPWVHGAALPYLGGQVRLCVGQPAGPSSQTPQVSTDEMPTLALSLPPGAGDVQVREAAEAWFKKKARALFEARLQHFAPLLGVRYSRLSLSSARTRWGSARVDGHIRLNWKLIHLPLAQIDYVVVHELAHLRVMDHSPRFWDTVGEVLPDYRERRRLLRDHDL